MRLQNRLRMGAAALCLMLVCLVAGGFGSALAEEARSLLEIRISAKPEEMVEPGEVMLSFTIENPTDTDAQNVYLSSADGLLSEPIGRIAAGESQSFNRQHSVSAEELDAGEISYTISHDDPQNPGGKVNYTVRTAIRRSDVQPRAEFTRQFSSRYVESGGTLTITYRVRNTGNVALSNLRVQDSLGDYTGRIERLEVGESRTLISRAVITEETVSSATLDFNADDAQQLFTQILADVPVYIAKTNVEMLFSANYSAFSDDTAEVLLTLTNTGNVDIRDVRVTDEVYGGVIADALVLPADGESIEVSRSYPLRGDMRFCWKLQGVSESGFEWNMRTAEERLSAVVDENPFAELRIEAATLTPRIRRSGDVSVFVRIDNPGQVDVRDVTLSEAALGELRRFEIVPGGGSVAREFIFHVTENTVYNFSISYTDAQGAVHTLGVAPVEFVIASDGVLPEGAKNSFIEFTGKSIKIGGSSTFAVLLIAGCTVLLVLIIMLLIASRRARFERKVRIAAQRQRRRADTAKPGPRTPKNKAKGR